MALTNEDLQAIAQLLDSKLDERFQPINHQISKLDERFQPINNQIDGLKSDLKQTERVLKNEIRKECSLVLDEVERVHNILDKHKADTTKHTA